MIRPTPIVAILIGALTAPLCAEAAKPAPLPAKVAPVLALSAGDRALVNEATRYLQALKSAQARFSQTDPRGAVTNGTFSLQRPGKARFAYDAPTDLTVVADGTNVNVYDGKLKTFDKYPLKQTPLALLLGDAVKFDKSVAVTGVTREKTGFTITLRDAAKQAEGRLALSFSTGPVALSGWQVVDAQGQRTSVRLSGLKTGVSLEAGLFVLKDPHPHTFKP
jgi:outer membrane lipoprotein-sorting protein